VSEARYAEFDDNLELVTESKQGTKVMRKTYKLLKELHNVKKGAFYQEACDDGDQEYMLITREHYKGSDNQECVVTDRSIVEDQPQWFVEVFQVTPQYMTREELDQWEAFKGRKAPRQVVSGEPSIAKRKVNWTPAMRAAQARRMKQYWNQRRAIQSIRSI
jgi:hypothetical protein